MNSKSKNEIIEVLYEAVEKSFLSLFTDHGDEHFYYCTIVMTEAGTPCISAQSYESLDKYIKENGMSDEDKADCKWSWADSPYFAYGYDEYFNKVEELFEERFADEESDNCQYENEYKTWLEAMETVMKMLDQKGIFGKGKNRDEIFIFSEEAPPDDESEEFYKCGQRLNPPTAYKKWLADLECSL